MKKTLCSIFFLASCFSNIGKAENGYLPDFMPVTDIVFMGAHNAVMSSKEGWVYAQQNQDLENLWKSGVRMIKIPIQWYKPSGPIETVKKGFNKVKEVLTKKPTAAPAPFFALCHEYPGNKNCIVTKVQRGGKDPQPVQQLFQRLVKLLEQNPKEIFILKLENYINHRSKENGTDQYSDQKAIEIFTKLFEDSGLAKYAIDLSQRGNSEPLTLGEMRATNKRIIILDGSSMPGMPSYINNFQTYSRQSHWDTELMKDCVLSSSDPSSPMFFEINNNPEVSIRSDSVEGKIVNSFKKVTGKGIEAGNYKKINSEENLKKRFEQCYKKHNVRPNIITTDFANEGDMKKYIEKLNRERVAEYKTQN